MRSTGVLNDLARYAMHQSRISSSVGCDFTSYFVPRGGFSSLWGAESFGQRQMPGDPDHHTARALACASRRIFVPVAWEDRADAACYAAREPQLRGDAVRGTRMALRSLHNGVAA